MGGKKLVPVICPKCGAEIMRTGVQLSECGFDIYCPHCDKWSHIVGTKEKPKKKVKKDGNDKNKRRRQGV